MKNNDPVQLKVRQVVETALYIHREKMWEKTAFFSEKWKYFKKIGPRAKTFRQVCQNCLQRVQRIFWRNSVFCKKNFRKYFGTFFENLLWRLSKLHSTWSEESSAESCDLQIMCFRDFFRTPYGNILSGLSKMPSMSPPKYWEHKKISGKILAVLNCPDPDFEQTMKKQRAKKIK